MISSQLIMAVRKEFRLDWGGIHGARHWARVMENGLRLARDTGANIEVIELFSVFHDSCRVNEFSDPGHGLRGAELAKNLRGKSFELGNEDFASLWEACRFHTDGLISGDITVQTCWDADRLDLGRVGVFPDAQLLCTPTARNFKMIQWANSRACADLETDVAANWLSVEFK